MKFIEFKTETGKNNMQIDSDLLDSAIENQTKEPIFRLYAWSPACVSLGRNQTDDFLDKDFLRMNNIDIVRRLTGGRALLHDKELTYCYICPVESLRNGGSVVNSYKEISQILIDGFEKLGINLEFPENKLHRERPCDTETSSARRNEKLRLKNRYCMSISTGADLSFNGKKLIGSAQLRKEGYILQHGSILFDYDKKLIEKIFDEQVDENALTCLKQINPKLDYDTVKCIFTPY